MILLCALYLTVNIMDFQKREAAGNTCPKNASGGTFLTPNQ